MRWVARVCALFLVLAAGFGYYWFSAKDTVSFAQPAPRQVVATTTPIATVTSTTAIPATTARVVAETTTTAAASTVPVLVRDPAEDVCAAAHADYVYIPKLDGLCRPLDYKDRDASNEFTPTRDYVSVDAAQSLPGETDKGYLSYLAGHVNQSNGVNVLERLTELNVGDTFVTNFGGVRHSFVIYDLKDWDKDDVAHEGGKLLQQMAGPETWIVTCGGEFNPFKRSYENNLIVLARLVA